MLAVEELISKNVNSFRVVANNEIFEGAIQNPAYHHHLGLKIGKIVQLKMWISVVA